MDRPDERELRIELRDIDLSKNTILVRRLESERDLKETIGFTKLRA